MANKRKDPDFKLTGEYVRQWFDYDPETGVVYRKKSKITNKVGAPAGSMMPNNGYIIIRFDGHWVYAHRLAHVWMTGSEPTGQMDHINGVKFDNRWSNLRDVSQSYNMQNTIKAGKNNSTGLRGVTNISQGRHKGTFSASIRINGEMVVLGYYPTPEEAFEVYHECKKLYHPGYVPRA